MNKLMEKPEVDGIELIIRDLNNTKLKFGQRLLHKENNGVCEYCGEGALMIKCGIDKKELTNKINLYDTQDKVTNDAMFYNRYGVHLLKMYEGWIQCQVCKKEPGLACLEEVINHYNDQHSLRHKDVAMFLKELHSSYNLITGEPKEIVKEEDDVDMPRIE